MLKNLSFPNCLTIRHVVEITQVYLYSGNTTLCYLYVFPTLWVVTSHDCLELVIVGVFTSQNQEML